MDTKTDLERSKNMAAIRSKNTGPELLLRRTLWRMGLRFFTAPGWERLTGHMLPGKPDLILPSARLVVFVDGCFWHGCPEHYRAPEDNQEYWKNKLVRNRIRDEQVNQELEEAGWRVIRLWAHDLRKGGHNIVAQTVQNAVKGCPPTQSATPEQ